MGPLRITRLLAVALATLSAATASDTVNVQLTGVVLTAPLPSDFVGYSIEVQRAPIMLGTPGALRGSYANLMRHLANLTPGGRGPNIRPGGSSADHSMWLPTPEACAGAPPNITYCINATDLQTYADAVAQWNGTITLDLDFRFPNATGINAAAAHIAAAVDVIGWERLVAIEIGNEPDLYHEAYSGVRPANFTYADYLQQYGEFVQGILEKGVLPPDRRVLQGGTYCCEQAYLSQWPQYLAAFGPTVLGSASQHVYPGVNGAAGRDDLPWMLSDNCSIGVAREMLPISQAAAAISPPVAMYVGESNSINNGGLANVSNVCGVALWSVDMLFNVAAVNVTRHLFHGGPWDWYDAIRYDNTSIVAPPFVAPLYYGHWLFSDAIANYSSLVGATSRTTNAQVKTWATSTATADGQRVMKVVIIHKDLNATGPATVQVALPPGTPTPTTAFARRLTCSGPYATSGLTFGGQTFDGSTDGTVQGEPVVQPVETDGHVFSLEVEPISIAVLTLVWE